MLVSYKLHHILYDTHSTIQMYTVTTVTLGHHWESKNTCSAQYYCLHVRCARCLSIWPHIRQNTPPLQQKPLPIGDHHTVQYNKLNTYIHITKTNLQWELSTCKSIASFDKTNNIHVTVFYFYTYLSWSALKSSRVIRSRTTFRVYCSSTNCYTTLHNLDTRPNYNHIKYASSKY